MNNERTGKNFIGVTIVIFFAKLLGFGRDIAFAFIFGTTVITDIYQAIFGLPSLLFSSIGTALSSVNIPNLTYYVTSRTKEERNQYIGLLYAQLTFWAALISVAGIIFAPALARLVAPGLEGEAADIAVITTRIMMPTFLFVNLTFVTTGILQVHEHFLRAAAISIPFNLLIIAALIIKGDDIVFLSYVTTIGWLFQFLIQLPVLIKEKYRFPLFNLKPAYTANVLKQLVPVLMGNSILQLCLIVDRSFATHLEPGTTSALSFGGNLFVTITSIFIVAMSSVVFPRLSKYSLERDYKQIRYMLGNIFKILLFILVPYLVYVVAYNHDIIALVYERGAFTSKSTTMTSYAFLLYSFAVVGYASQEIFNRVFYALKQFTMPMLASIVCLAVNVVLNMLLLDYGIIAISASTAFALLLYALITGFLIKKQVGAYFEREFLGYLAKLAVPTAAMLGIIILFKQLGLSGLVLSFLLPAVLSGLVYLGIAYKGGLITEFNLREAKK